MSSKVDALHKEIIDFVEKMVDPDKIESESRWHKEPIITYRFDKTDYNKIFRKFDSHFCDLGFEEAIELGGKFIRSGNNTIIHIGIHLLCLKREEFNPTHFKHFDEFLNHFVGWGNVDHFSVGKGSVLQTLLERHPDKVIKLLKKWNQSDNRWKRRASVVVFTRRVAESGKFIDEAIDLCENLIWDQEDLVKKGVGWALKDNIRADKERVLKYVKSLRSRGVSSVITLYAIRDLNEKERKEALRITKKRQREPKNND